MINFKNKRALNFKIKLVTIAVSLSLFPAIYGLSQNVQAMELYKIQNNTKISYSNLKGEIDKIIEQIKSFIKLMGQNIYTKRRVKDGSVENVKACLSNIQNTCIYCIEYLYYNYLSKSEFLKIIKEIKEENVCDLFKEIVRKLLNLIKYLWSVGRNYTITSDDEKIINKVIEAYFSGGNSSDIKTVVEPFYDNLKIKFQYQTCDDKNNKNNIKENPPYSKVIYVNVAKDIGKFLKQIEKLCSDLSNFFQNFNKNEIKEDIVENEFDIKLEKKLKNEKNEKNEKNDNSIVNKFGEQVDEQNKKAVKCKFSLKHFNYAFTLLNIRNIFDEVEKDFKNLINNYFDNLRKEKNKIDNSNIILEIDEHKLEEFEDYFKKMLSWFQKDHYLDKEILSSEDYEFVRPDVLGRYINSFLSFLEEKKSDEKNKCKVKGETFINFQFKEIKKWESIFKDIVEKLDSKIGQILNDSNKLAKSDSYFICIKDVKQAKKVATRILNRIIVLKNECGEFLKEFLKEKNKNNEEDIKNNSNKYFNKINFLKKIIATFENVLKGFNKFITKFDQGFERSNNFSNYIQIFKKDIEKLTKILSDNVEKMDGYITNQQFKDFTNQQFKDFDDLLKNCEQNLALMLFHNIIKAKRIKTCFSLTLIKDYLNTENISKKI